MRTTQRPTPSSSPHPRPAPRRTRQLLAGRGGDRARDPAAGLDRCVARGHRRADGRPGHAGHGLRGGNGPRFFTLTYAWRYHPTFADWALRGPLIELSRQVLPGARSLTHFFDQIFAREAGATKTTPFHQDQPYSPATEPDHYFRHWVATRGGDRGLGAVRYLARLAPWPDLSRSQASTRPTRLPRSTTTPSTSRCYRISRRATTPTTGWSVRSNRAT